MTPWKSVLLQADGRSATNEISWIFRFSKGHFCVDKPPLLDYTLHQTNPFSVIAHCNAPIHLNLCLPSAFFPALFYLHLLTPLHATCPKYCVILAVTVLTLLIRFNVVQLLTKIFLPGSEYYRRHSVQRKQFMHYSYVVLVTLATKKLTDIYFVLN